MSELEKRIDELIGMPTLQTFYTGDEYDLKVAGEISGSWYSWRQALVKRLVDGAAIIPTCLPNGIQGTTLRMDFKPLKRGVSVAELIKILRNRSVEDSALTSLVDKLEEEGIRD